MQFNVATLLQEALGSQRSYRAQDELARTVADCDVPGYERRVSGELELMRTDRGVLVRAQLRVAPVLQCGRCLTEYVQPLSLLLREEFGLPADPRAGPPEEEPERDPTETEFLIDEHHILDLSEAVRQYEQTALPLQPVCQAGCEGLCAGCGQNLNQGPCGCPAQPARGRWQALGALAERLRTTEDSDGGTEA